MSKDQKMVLYISMSQCSNDDSGTKGNFVDWHLIKQSNTGKFKITVMDDHLKIVFRKRVQN